MRLQACIDLAERNPNIYYIKNEINSPNNFYKDHIFSSSHSSSEWWRHRHSPPPTWTASCPLPATSSAHASPFLPRISPKSPPLSIYPNPPRHPIPSTPFHSIRFTPNNIISVCVFDFVLPSFDGLARPRPQASRQRRPRGRRRHWQW